MILLYRSRSSSVRLELSKQLALLRANRRTKTFPPKRVNSACSVSEVGSVDRRRFDPARYQRASGGPIGRPARLRSWIRLGQEMRNKCSRNKPGRDDGRRNRDTHHRVDRPVARHAASETPLAPTVDDDLHAPEPGRPRKAQPQRRGAVLPTVR